MARAPMLHRLSQRCFCTECLRQTQNISAKNPASHCRTSRNLANSLLRISTRTGSQTKPLAAGTACFALSEDPEACRSVPQNSQLLVWTFLVRNLGCNTAIVPGHTSGKFDGTA